MSYPGQLAETQNDRETEICDICKDEVPKRHIFYANGDGEIVCENCYGNLEAQAELAWDAWKEEHNTCG